MSECRLFLRKIYGLTILGLLLIGLIVTFENVHFATGQGSWWNADWGYRKTITIDHTKVSASLTDFPLLINITDPDLASKAQNDGDDIVFTDSTPTKLNHEIEFYNYNTGFLIAWVKANLSSTTDKVLQMYYGNPTSSNQQNPTGVWDSDYAMVQHLEEAGAPVSSASPWRQYEGNPILNANTDGFGSAFYDSNSGIYHFYCSWGSVLHYTSPNGKTGWTADPLNPMLTGNNEGVPMVWKESGVWYMLYRYGGPDKIGLATSTDASTWTRYAGNPVINVGSFCDPWGIIKVDSTYYLWVNDGFGGSGRGAQLATSTNLINWTWDTNAVFSGGRYCIFPFKYGSYYYMLVPHYTTLPYGEIELYRCTSPTFYASQREYLGIVVPTGPTGSWYQYRHDTPCVLTDNIYRDTFAAANNELWMYYASTPDSGSKWWTGLCVEENMTDAIARFQPQIPPVISDSTANYNNGVRGGNLNMNVTGKIDGADYFTAATQDYINCGNNASLKGMSALTIEAWVNLASLPSGGTGIVSKWSSSTSGSYLIWQGGSGTVNWGVITSSWKTTASTSALTTGQWYHIVGVYDGSQIRLYINSGQVGTPTAQTGSVMSENTPCYIGRYTTPYWNGKIDEVRISKTSRSVNWITTEYNNQLNPSTFYTVGTEEAREAKLSVSPSLTEKTPGDIGTTFDVEVTIQDVKDMWAFEFNLTWDNTLITFDSVEFNTTLDAIWGYGRWFVASNETGVGSYKLAAVSLENGFNSTGVHAIAALAFRVEDPHCNFLRETTIHFTTHKLSNAIPQPIDHSVQDGTYRIDGEKPSLNLDPTTKTCRKYGETFNIGVRASQIFNVTDFEFEIHFNTTLLDYSSINWNVWGTGTLTVDEAGGNITGVTSGALVSGDQTLIAIEFRVALHHIWKNLPGWINDLNGKILIQWANLSYPSKPDLGYVKGSLDQISVGPDLAYTFSPIQGDIDNGGNVDIMDLRTIAAFYDQVSVTYNLTGDAVVDIFDLVVIGSNFGFTYTP